jgi:hypothetical protein
MGLRVEQGIRRSSKRVVRLVPYESPAFRRGENVKLLPTRLMMARCELALHEAESRSTQTIYLLLLKHFRSVTFL